MVYLLARQELHIAAVPVVALHATNAHSPVMLDMGSSSCSSCMHLSLAHATRGPGLMMAPEAAETPPQLKAGRQQVP
jgi:hypothetical protein